MVIHLAILLSSVKYLSTKALLLLIMAVRLNYACFLCLNLALAIKFASFRIPFTSLSNDSALFTILGKEFLDFFSFFFFLEGASLVTPV